MLGAWANTSKYQESKWIAHLGVGGICTFELVVWMREWMLCVNPLLTPTLCQTSKGVWRVKICKLKAFGFLKPQSYLLMCLNGVLWGLGSLKETSPVSSNVLVISWLCLFYRHNGHSNSTEKLAQLKLQIMISISVKTRWWFQISFNFHPFKWVEITN